METYTDEIDLREYIELLWRRRKLVIGITLTAAVVAALLSFYVMKPVYEASSQFMAPQNPLPAEVIKSPSFMQGIIQELQLEEQHNPFSLARAVSLETSKASATLTTVKVQAQDPVLAARIANRISSRFVEFLREKNEESKSEIISQLTAEKAEDMDNLESIRNRIADLKEATGVDALKAEVARLANQIASYSSQQMAADIQEKELRAGITELSAALASTPKTVSGPPDWSGQPTQIPNATYQSLEQSLALAKVQLAEVQIRLEQVANTLPALRKDYESKYASLLSHERQIQDLQAQEAILADRVESLSEQISELTSSLPEVSIVSSAVEPVEPIKPRKLVNVAVATVLGGFISLLVVFGIEFWQSPRKATTVVG
ncbi:MAG: GumC family protein [Bacillota bacterium]